MKAHPDYNNRLFYFLSAVIGLLSCLFCFHASAQERLLTKPQPNECVVSLHGLGRTYSSLSKMAESLSELGFIIANIDYQSRKKTIEQLAYIAVPAGVNICNGRFID